MNKLKNSGVTLIEILISMTISILVMGMAISIYTDIKHHKQKIEDKNEFLATSFKVKQLFTSLIEKEGMDCMKNEHTWLNNLDNKTSLISVASNYPSVFSYQTKYSNIENLVHTNNIEPASDFLLIQGADAISTISSTNTQNTIIKTISQTNDIQGGDLLLFCNNNYTNAGYTLAEALPNINNKNTIPLLQPVPNIALKDFVGKYSMYILFTGYTDKSKTKTALYIYSLADSKITKPSIAVNNISKMKIRYYLDGKWQSVNSLSIDDAKTVWQEHLIKGLEISFLINDQASKININLNGIGDFDEA